MEKLYYTDSYLRKIECTVIWVEGNLVRTDRTIFYPEGGGQRGDSGKLGAFRVINTVKDADGDSLLVMEEGARIEAGDVLDLELDWKSRYNGMVIHTCQHMLSGLLYSMYGIGTLAVHMGEDYLTIETDRETVAESTIAGLVGRANEVIAENHRVSGVEMEHGQAVALGLRRPVKVSGPVRIVEIEGVDRIACGGVHVSHTSEIRLAVFTGHEQVRGHERLVFRCGEGAVLNAVSDSRTVHGLCSILSCTDDQITGKTEALLSENQSLKARNSSLLERNALYRLTERLSEKTACYVADDDEDLGATGRCVEHFADIALCVLQQKNDRFVWLIALKGCFAKDFGRIRQNLLVPFNARGGGKGPLYQGIMEKCNPEEFFNAFRLAAGL